MRNSTKDMSIELGRQIIEASKDGGVIHDIITGDLSQIKIKLDKLKVLRKGLSLLCTRVKRSKESKQDLKAQLDEQHKIIKLLQIELAKRNETNVTEL